MCGVLHISWQTSNAVKGEYLICLLYHDVLCLASAGQFELVYGIRACIDLTTARLEEAESDRGMLSPALANAPHHLTKVHRFTMLCDTVFLEIGF